MTEHGMQDPDCIPTLEPNMVPGASTPFMVPPPQLASNDMDVMHDTDMSFAGSHVLSLADAIAMPKPMVDASLVPSLGSVGHDKGSCKPCGFFHKAGCKAGATCNYCHLCDAGEKKRRSREKKETLRGAHQRRQ